MAKAAPATRERPTGPVVAIAAAAPLALVDEALVLGEPEVPLLEPVAVVTVLNPREVTLLPLLAEPVEEPGTAAELPDPELASAVADERGTAGAVIPAGIDAAGGWDVTAAG